MKKTFFLLTVVAAFICCAAFSYHESNLTGLIPIPPSVQRTGDSARGYKYLATGDFLKSGFPYDFFIAAKGKSTNYLHREGKNANVDFGYNVVTTADSIDIVIPTCMQCHAGIFDGKLVVGLGNSAVDFTDFGSKAKQLALLKNWKLTAPRKYNAVKSLITSMSAVNPLMEPEVRGVNTADRLAALLVAHRDPQTLAWSDAPLLNVGTTVVPTDVPAWWLLKKKNAMFYNGFGRGDFTMFLMLSNILTVTDTTEAREVYGHFGDVLAYIRSIQPPAYPQDIDQPLAATGKEIF